MRKRALSSEEKKKLDENTLAALLPNGPPQAGSMDQFLELYKMMVASSEALVSRRQGVNTFFLTVNGLVLTAVGLFLRSGGHQRLDAGGIFVLVVTGGFLCVVWRSLLISAGQLNTGKFKVINSMEKYLASSVFLAEWKALADGADKRVYRSFTAREAQVPVGLICVYTLAAVLSGLVWAGFWHIGK